MDRSVVFLSQYFKPQFFLLLQTSILPHILQIPCLSCCQTLNLLFWYFDTHPWLLWTFNTIVLFKHTKPLSLECLISTVNHQKEGFLIYLKNTSSVHIHAARFRSLSENLITAKEKSFDMWMTVLHKFILIQLLFIIFHGGPTLDLDNLKNAKSLFKMLKENYDQS